MLTAVCISRRSDVRAHTRPRAGSVLVGRDARASGARLFIRAFGARDVLLGAGTQRGLVDRNALPP